MTHLYLCSECDRECTMYTDSPDLPMYCPYHGGIVPWNEDESGGY